MNYKTIEEAKKDANKPTLRFIRDEYGNITRYMVCPLLSLIIYRHKKRVRFLPPLLYLYLISY